MEIVSLPVVISREGKWFVAVCPLLDLASQGASEGEARENLKDMIDDYLSDPDTVKPALKAFENASITMTTIPVDLKGVLHGRHAAVAHA